MSTYIAKRLLLMIPTLFGISLVVFLIINLAPGKPKADRAGEAGERPGSRESYRVFKSQFHLDKPVLVNLRPFLGQEDIEATLRRALDGTPAERVEALERLEDLGQDAVPFLVAALEHSDSRVADLAAAVLAENSQRPVQEVRLAPGQADYTPAQRKALDWNREIVEENTRLRSLRYLPGDPADRRREVHGAWRTWHEGAKGRYERGFWHAVWTVLFDTRYGHYLGNLLTGNLGISSENRRPVWELIWARMPLTFALAFLALLIEYTIAVPIGIYSAVRQNTAGDRAIALALFMLYSLPSFYVGTVLLRYLTIGEPWQILPTGGLEAEGASERTALARLVNMGQHLILPLACLTYASFAGLSRFARVGIVEVIRADFVRTARAKGLPERMVILKHTLRNGVIPLLTLMAGILPSLMGGAVIVESIFNLPGVGLLHLEAIYARDWNVIMGIDLMVALLVLLGMLMTDLAYAMVDPRITFD